MHSKCHLLSCAALLIKKAEKAPNYTFENCRAVLLTQESTKVNCFCCLCPKVRKSSTAAQLDNDVHGALSSYYRLNAHPRVEAHWSKNDQIHSKIFFLFKNHFLTFLDFLFGFNFATDFFSIRPLCCARTPAHCCFIGGR